MASNVSARRLSLFALLGLLAILGAAHIVSFAPTPTRGTQPLTSITGAVRGAGAPLRGALVRYKGKAATTRTDALGRFSLPGLSGESAYLTAWKDGYFIAGADANRQSLVLDLRPLPAEDCETYPWVDPTPSRTVKDYCGNCHGEIYREWAASGHAQSATNRRFLSLYDGSDWHGKPGVGWSLRDEQPDGVGVCTACHAPTVPHGDAAYFDLSKVRGVARHGVHCDYCHKITDAGLGTIGLTHGRFGIELLRPAKGQQFFGPLDDVDRGEDAYSPLYRDSRYCASCHEGTVLGVHVYGTYSEWLQSSARKEGKQCQTCHAKPTGKMTNVAPGHGGIERDPKTLGNHLFFAGSQGDMLRRALEVSVASNREGDACRAIVEIRAGNAGHRLPTGFPDRHLALIVEAVDVEGKRVQPLSGPTLPEQAGRGAAGLPGRLYARLLKDDSGHWPVPFWRADDGRTEDTRLAAGRPDRVDFRFPSKASRVRIRLLHRRTWPEVAEAKAWPDNETIVMDRFLDLP
jgi:hypothetical protein